MSAVLRIVDESSTGERLHQLTIALRLVREKMTVRETSRAACVQRCGSTTSVRPRSIAMNMERCGDVTGPCEELQVFETLTCVAHECLGGKRPVDLDDGSSELLYERAGEEGLESFSHRSSVPNWAPDRG